MGLTHTREQVEDLLRQLTTAGDSTAATRLALTVSDLVCERDRLIEERDRLREERDRMASRLTRGAARAPLTAA